MKYGYFQVVLAFFILLFLFAPFAFAKPADIIVENATLVLGNIGSPPASGARSNPASDFFVVETGKPLELDTSPISFNFGTPAEPAVYTHGIYRIELIRKTNESMSDVELKVTRLADADFPETILDCKDIASSTCTIKADETKRREFKFDFPLGLTSSNYSNVLILKMEDNATQTINGNLQLSQFEFSLQLKGTQFVQWINNPHALFTARRQSEGISSNPSQTVNVSIDFDTDPNVGDPKTEVTLLQTAVKNVLAHSRTQITNSRKQKVFPRYNDRGYAQTDFDYSLTHAKDNLTAVGANLDTLLTTYGSSLDDFKVLDQRTVQGTGKSLLTALMINESGASPTEIGKTGRENSPLRWDFGLLQINGQNLPSSRTIDDQSLNLKDFDLSCGTVREAVVTQNKKTTYQIQFTPGKTRTDLEACSDWKDPNSNMKKSTVLLKYFLSRGGIYSTKGCPKDKFNNIITGFEGIKLSLREFLGIVAYNWGPRGLKCEVDNAGTVHVIKTVSGGDPEFGWKIVLWKLYADNQVENFLNETPAVEPDLPAPALAISPCTSILGCLNEISQRTLLSLLGKNVRPYFEASAQLDEEQLVMDWSYLGSTYKYNVWKCNSPANFAKIEFALFTSAVTKIEEEQCEVIASTNQPGYFLTTNDLHSGNALKIVAYTNSNEYAAESPVIPIIPALLPLEVKIAGFQVSKSTPLVVSTRMVDNAEYTFTVTYADSTTFLLSVNRKPFASPTTPSIKLKCGSDKSNSISLSSTSIDQTLNCYLKSSDTEPIVSVILRDLSLEETPASAIFSLQFPNVSEFFNSQLELAAYRPPVAPTPGAKVVFNTLPTSYSVVTSCFGARVKTDGCHDGIDFRTRTFDKKGKLIRQQEPVYAMADGTVFAICSTPGKGENPCPSGTGFGKSIIIKHSSTLYVGYNHLSTIESKLKVNDSVTAGQKIATSGNTGGVVAHLDIKVYTAESDLYGKDTAQNPFCYFSDVLYNSLTFSGASCKGFYQNRDKECTNTYKDLSAADYCPKEQKIVQDAKKQKASRVATR